VSTLREAAQAALEQWDKVSGVFRMTAETEALRAALAQPETEAAIGPEWTPCVKLPITVHVREQRDGEQHVSTREGITPVKPDDLIMRGVAGEEYPIGRELFAKTYRIGDKLPPDDAEPAASISSQQRAIEFGRYLANATERLVDAINALAEAEQKRDETDSAEDDGAVDDAHESLGEAISGARSTVYEFRKRADRATLSIAPPRSGWRPASEPPEDGRDVVVWCAQERRAVHGMYVRRHPPVVGLVDGWVAPDASKLTHWRDVSPPAENQR
jgi:hypothetical protein